MMTASVSAFQLLPAVGRHLRLAFLLLLVSGLAAATDRPRVLVTTDGEVDDECSMVRFLLYANEWDVEAIINSSSQYHWQGSKLWAGTDWVHRYLDAYQAVHANLVRHDPRYPTAEFLRSRLYVGNIKAEGEMEEITPGSQRIVEVLLDRRDPRPVWVQAWGGTNTLARALKTIEEQHPDRREEVARKLRLYLIWEQDDTYQRYIRPNWGRFGIQTIISDQFIVFFYHWKKYLPARQQTFLAAPWMNTHILENHGPLCARYPARRAGEPGFAAGDFRSEGDSAAFLHTVPNGLRSEASPDWGGWGGRFVRVRENTWLDPVSEPGYQYPDGRWYTQTAWGRARLRKEIPNDAALTAYLEPQWRWLEAIQNDFAARADWCVKEFKEANHAPVVTVAGPLHRTVRPGQRVDLVASATDPDGDTLTCLWWQYAEADSADARVTIEAADSRDRAYFTVPREPGRQIHIILEVTDRGAPPLVAYQRLVFDIR
ncbi:MAG TPA: DUF1593 domain-containing protein [Opitutaceae bacterium]|jgi:hypothetical protein|nr:DUF1593 domain-containing protein [Opitutaceae bacterium]HRE05831.1 DUF1593 domain-containing protein [Opitutaceae bacterium]